MSKASIPWLIHHACSLTCRCSSRWCNRHTGTVNLSLTLRPIARCSANLMWWASDGVRPQTRQSGNKLQVLAVALAHRFADDGDFF